MQSGELSFNDIQDSSTSSPIMKAALNSRGPSSQPQNEFQRQLAALIENTQEILRNGQAYTAATAQLFDAKKP